MLISMLSKDIQMYIWKLVYDDMLKDLKSHTANIATILNVNTTEDQERNMICYKYYRFCVKGWGLLTSCGGLVRKRGLFVSGSHEVSNEYQIRARPKYKTLK